MTSHTIQLVKKLKELDDKIKDCNPEKIKKIKEKAAIFREGLNRHREVAATRGGKQKRKSNKSKTKKAKKSLRKRVIKKRTLRKKL